METDPFPVFMWDIEHSVITSDIMKSFDCILFRCFFVYEKQCIILNML